MSEATFEKDILSYVTQSCCFLKEKTFELQTTREDEEESNLPLADDELDDSSSSYCTALCSLSEYSEALEDETQMTFHYPPCKNASVESSKSVANSGQTVTNSSSENTNLLQDLKTELKDGKVILQDVLSKNVSVKNPVLILNMNLINLNSVDADQGSTSTSTPDPPPWDYFKIKKDAAQTDTKPVQTVGTVKYKITPNIILTRYEGKHNQEHSDVMSEQHPTTLQQSFRNAHYKATTEFKLDSGESIISKMKWEGEDQGVGVEKEQAELSLSTGNRKPPAGCTVTLTANKQKSEILPRCYFKRLLATRNQHQSRSPPVSRRLKKQGGQDIGLSTSLSPTPRSSFRQHYSSADNTKGKFTMATKVAGTSREVRGLAALEYTRPSCPETNYLDVFNSTCWSSTQMSCDKNFYDWSKDVLSFKVPMISTNNNNTSACSEASSFECIDVALEYNEKVDRNTKTVPKRQIQLKRRDKAESYDSEKDIILSTPSRPRDILQRQHSTPATFHQDLHGSETKPGQTEQKQKLQKSLSLDETSSKTKMASCIIKNVLIKRMQHEQNLHNVDDFDQTFCPIKADGTVNNTDYMTSGPKEECTGSIKENLATVPFLSTSSQNPMLKTMSSIKEHISVSSKILPKLITKHSFNPLLGGLCSTQFHGSATEIAAYSKTEKETLSPSMEANQVSREKLSCDSAKGKAWNLSAVTSGAVGKQVTVKTTPEEFVNVPGPQKQHNVKDQPIEKQEKPGERKENTQSPTVSVWLACSLDASTVDNVLSQSAQCNRKKDQESSKEELRPHGQSVNMGIQSQGKFRAIAPVHVVRDMRSLVKNTYSRSFRGPSEAEQGLDDISCYATAAPHPTISKRENKVKEHKQDKKTHVPKVTVPCALDKVMDLASIDTTFRECAMKGDSILESNDKILHTGLAKVSLISAGQPNSCGLSKSPEANDSLTNVQCSNTYMQLAQQTTCAIQAHKGTLPNISKYEQSAKPKTFAAHQTQPLATESLFCLHVESSDQQGSCKLSNQVDGHQTPGLPAKSQSSAGPPSACILTVAPVPVFPSYFYKPNLLGYQTISPNMGTVSYVQGPVLLQTYPHSQPVTASDPAPLIKSSFVEEQVLSQPCTADGYPVTLESSKQMENGGTSQKMPSSDTQTCFVTTLGTEGIHRGASMLYPEMSGSQHVSNPRHMLLDPETGQYFYVDMPQLPQRKMLFDPETCQYVEVVVPQQTLSSTVMTNPCAIPFPSLHIPTMYPPHCLSYVQTHQQVLPPPEP